MALLQPATPIPAAQPTPTAATAAEAAYAPQSTFAAEPLPQTVVIEVETPPFAAQPAAVPVPVPTGTAAATCTQAASGGGVAVADFAEAGFEGLVVDSRTYPIINLKNDGRFKDMDDVDYGTEMRGRQVSSLEKSVFSAKFPDPVNPSRMHEESIFSNDGVISTTGRAIADWKDEMTKRNATITVRKYTDVLVVMDAPGKEYDGELRYWSIAPCSRGRLTGTLGILAHKAGWKTPMDIKNNIGNHTLVATVGAQVKGDGGDFFPWNFRTE